MARILAIDFGLKRVGLAVTDPMKIIANGLETVPTVEVMKYLKNYLQKEKVECFVVGKPMRMNNEPSPIEENIKEFVKALQKEFPEVKIAREDERFTSKMAVQSMVMGGMKKQDRRQKENVDKISATIILQSYLEHL